MDGKTAYSESRPNGLHPIDNKSPQQVEQPPSRPAGGLAAAGASAAAWTRHTWDTVAYGLNCEWINWGKMPSAIILCLLLIGLALAVGLTAVPIKNGVTLGVEFGGGYSITYQCVQKPDGLPVTEEAVKAQTTQMYEICESKGQPNSQVTMLKPAKIVVMIPGVTSKEQIGPILDAFNELPLGLEVRSAVSMSGSMGRQDLKDTVTAAGVALAIVWAGLILRYHAAGLLGLYLSIGFIWLLMLFFNASSYALSDAAIVAVVLNVGLAADAHIIAFERVREDLHALPRDAARAEGLAALQRGLRISLVTVLEANITTLLAMVVLYGVGVGATVEFAFTVIISVCASMLINVVLARCILRLAWNAEYISTGGFFGDKGPQYDEDWKETAERMKKTCLCPHWKPRRQLNFNYVRFWWIGGIITAAVVIPGCILMGIHHGLNWGVDYTAGTNVNMVIPPPYDYTCADVVAYAENRSNATVSRCQIAEEGRVTLRFKDAVDPYKLKIIIYRITTVLGGPIVYNEFTIDNSLSVEQSRRAITAMVVSAAVTCVFMLLRFGPAFSLSGLLSMVSAGLFAVCCFAMGEWEVNLPFVSAVLTVFSYAINDSVVVFDRIRFEMEQTAAGGTPANTPAALKATVNRALSLVTIRSLLTLAVVIVCAICLVIMGPSGLHSFALAIIFGLLNATYTTVLICAPFWYLLRFLVVHCRQPQGQQAEAGQLKGSSSVSAKSMLTSTTSDAETKLAAV